MSSFAGQDLFRKNKQFLGLGNQQIQNTSLELSFFPHRVFPSGSPNYEVYSRICKEISKEKENIDIKWLALSLFSSSAVEYRNIDFLEEISTHLLGMGQGQDDKIKSEQVDILGIIIFSYNLMRKKDEKLWRYIQHVQELYIGQSYEKSTPAAWVQIFATLSNLQFQLEESEVDLVKVIFRDRILPHLAFLDLSHQISLAWSFCFF